jgi:hypothetical protein
VFFIFPDGRFVPRWTRWLSPFLIPWALGYAYWQTIQLDAARVLAQFGASVRHDVDLDDLTHGLLAVVDTTMQPAHATLWLAPAAAPSRGNIEAGDPLTSVERF